MGVIVPVDQGEIIGQDSADASRKPVPSNEMGYDQFLQLLCAEMQYQDPLEPTNNTEYVAQLATFSQMEAMLAVQNTVESSNANSLVGQYVIIKSTSSTGVTTYTEGFVDYIQKENGQQMVSVNGSLYPLSDIYQVADPEFVEATAVAGAFSAQVLKMPDPGQVTSADLTDIENLIKVYESMSGYQRSYITDEAMEKFKGFLQRYEDITGHAYGENPPADESPEVSDGENPEVPDVDGENTGGTEGDADPPKETPEG